jgi:hypothetical protein
MQPLSFSSINMQLFKLIAFACLVIFCSCAQKQEGLPAGILTKDKMIVVLVDIHLAEASNENRSLTAIQLNEIVARKYDTVMKKHDITYVQFKTSFEYYLRNPDQFDEIYQEVVNRLSAMEGKSRAKKPHMESSRVDSI